MDVSYYTTFDLPIQYKSIKIYPILVKDVMPLSLYSSCLTLDKNSSPNPEIISMSYLKYLYYLNTVKDAEPYLAYFDRLLGLCLKDDSSFNDPMESLKRYRYENGEPYFIIGDEKFYSFDFEEMRNIISQQNMIELPDENMSIEVRKSLEDARRYKNKSNNENPASLEDYIISLSVVTGWEFDYIYSMPYRKFIKAIRRYDNYVHYKIYLSASLSGFVEFKDKSVIKHWLSNIDDTDKYSDVSVELDKLKEKVGV